MNKETRRGCEAPDTALHLANDGCNCDCGKYFCKDHYDSHFDENGECHEEEEG